MTQPAAKRIRVLIVEDSAATRMLLERIVADDPRLEVAASVASGEDALNVIDRVAPDVISMDIRLPGIDGFETTRRIMAERPTPIVVISASIEAEDLAISMNALRAGALSVLEKPVGLSHAAYQAVAQRMCRTLVLMSDVKLVRQRGMRSPTIGMHRTARARSSPPQGLRCVRRSPGKILGLVASTGGPNALVELLGDLGADYPLPILVVQHITPAFLNGFVRWLDNTVELPVRAAADGTVPEPGNVYVAPADRHLRLDRWRLRLVDEPAVSGQRPSGTVLFESMARCAGAGAVAVLLTGMGDDGAEGMRQIHVAGGHTIAEHETTAVVYGMPAAAISRGAVCESLPLPMIAPRLRELAIRRRTAST